MKKVTITIVANDDKNIENAIEYFGEHYTHYTHYRKDFSKYMWQIQCGDKEENKYYRIVIQNENLPEELTDKTRNKDFMDIPVQYKVNPKIDQGVDKS